MTEQELAQSKANEARIAELRGQLQDRTTLQGQQTEIMLLESALSPPPATLGEMMLVDEKQRRAAAASAPTSGFNWSKPPSIGDVLAATRGR